MPNEPMTSEAATPVCKGIELGDGNWSGCACDCPTCAAAAKALPCALAEVQRITEERETYRNAWVRAEDFQKRGQERIKALEDANQRLR